PPGMPVWGERLYAGEREESPAREEARRGAILLILEYLQTLQQPPETPDGARPAPPDSGPDTTEHRRAAAGPRAKLGRLRPGPGVRSAQDMIPAGARCVVEPVAAPGSPAAPR